MGILGKEKPSHVGDGVLGLNQGVLVRWTKTPMSTHQQTVGDDRNCSSTTSGGPRFPIPGQNQEGLLLSESKIREPPIISKAHLK